MIDSSKVHIKVILLRSNPVTYDARVLKEAKILLDNGYSVSILGWDRENKFNVHDSIDSIPVDRIKIHSSYGSGIRNIWSLLKWQFSEFLYLLKHDFDIVHACDFDTVIPAYLVARIKHKKIIYDVFDFYADSILSLPRILRTFIRTLDRNIMVHVDALILCDESRLNQVDINRRDIVFIYNSPPDVLSTLKENDTANPSGKFVIVYVGLLDNRTRDLNQLIEACKSLTNNVNLRIGGYGPSAEDIQKVSQRLDFVTYLGPLSYSDVLKEEYKSNLLIGLYDPIIPNHKFTSPNKLFEAMMLAKPFIINDGLGEISEFVKKNNIGLTFEYGNINSLAKAIQIIYEDGSLAKEMGKNGRNLYETKYSDKINEKQLLAIYNRLKLD